MYYKVAETINKTTNVPEITGPNMGAKKEGIMFYLLHVVMYFQTKKPYVISNKTI
jgi:hypothetical protein